MIALIYCLFLPFHFIYLVLNEHCFFVELPVLALEYHFLVFHVFDEGIGLFNASFDLIDGFEHKNFIVFLHVGQIVYFLFQGSYFIFVGVDLPLEIVNFYLFLVYSLDILSDIFPAVIVFLCLHCLALLLEFRYSSFLFVDNILKVAFLLYEFFFCS